MRPTKDEYYADLAAIVATRSTCIKKRYGAVIVKDDMVVATGYNGAPRGEENCCDRGYCWADAGKEPISEKAAKHGQKYGSCVAVHAEQNAMLTASREQMLGATLYLTCLDEANPAPCNICDRMIRNAGIARVVVGERSVTTGGCDA